ncbi:MAG: putative Phageintegrase domain-containing protein [Nitrospira sp.]|nr:MAG: putative Phageintegrase domain-containing protein [Nitrospira sp.]
MVTTFLRYGTYYARLFIPTDLRGILRRTEFQRSLGTKFYREAKTKAGVWSGHMAALFVRLRMTRESRMTPEEITALVNQYASIRLGEWEEAWYGGDNPGCEAVGTGCDADGEPYSDHWQDALALFTQADIQDYAKALKLGTAQALAVIEPIATDFLARHNLSVPQPSPLYRRLCRELAKAEMGIAQEVMKRLQGDYSSSYSGISAASSQGGPRGVELRPSKPMSEVLAAYFAEHKRQPRTDSQMRSGFSKFLEIIGGDCPIQRLSKSHCRQYKETLMRLPKAMSAKERGLSLKDLLETLEKKGSYEKLGVASVNKYLHNLAHLFGWAESQGFYEGANPAKNLTLSRHGRRGGGHEAFTDGELWRIFGAQEFKAQTLQRPERYWMTLSLLHTGARREEVAQLNLADIVNEDGVEYFNFTDEGEGQKVKTQASKRRVPIHSTLIALGFLDYAARMKRGGHSRLFPMLKRGQNGYGDPVGKWFGRFLHKVGITDPAKVMHSFRDTANTLLAVLRVPETYRLALIGHEGQTVNETHYLTRSELPIKELQREVEKLNFEACLKPLLIGAV